MASAPTFTKGSTMTPRRTLAVWYQASIGATVLAFATGLFAGIPHSWAVIIVFSLLSFALFSEVNNWETILDKAVVRQLPAHGYSEPVHLAEEYSYYIQKRCRLRSNLVTLSMFGLLAGYRIDNAGSLSDPAAVFFIALSLLTLLDSRRAVRVIALYLPDETTPTNSPKPTDK
jgi:hypothetical protein